MAYHSFSEDDEWDYESDEWGSEREDDHLHNDLEDNKSSSESTTDSEDDEQFPSRQDDSVLPAEPSSLALQMYRKVRVWCYIERCREPFLTPNDPCGPLKMFLAEAHMPEYADEDRRREFTEKTFTSLVQLIMSGLATEDDPREIFAVSHIAYLVVRELTQDRMTQPDHLGCKPVPTNNFDAIVRYAANWKKKAAERIITSLEPLNVALEDFFSHSDSEPLPNVWSVIMWWLRSPFYRNIFEPAPLVSRSVCVEQLKKIEGGLRGSEELLNKEKADMIKKWLLREAPEDINQARRYEGWKNLYFRSQ
ncbi:hypothetical protein E8E14_008331 [Neopestalotiopsis sp. 37M]|nr:hypothetical protein E8E14_008331 [Neopestalotiopsis sp. 37M]